MKKPDIYFTIICISVLNETNPKKQIILAYYKGISRNSNVAFDVGEKKSNFVAKLASNDVSFVPIVDCVRGTTW